ncbi:hypothetical protein I4U23_024229 [Adineta vaga]|nr:hypothetical protein I4U23_024229 [Adineta vaga]
MANSSSSSTSGLSSINDTEHSYSDIENEEMPDEMNNHLSKLFKHHILSNAIRELHQIEYEQCLIVDEITRIDAEKQRLQDLLELVRSMKSNVQKKTTKSQLRQIKRINSHSKQT